MSKLPSVTGDEAIRAFAKIGFADIRTNGSHHVLKKEGHAHLLTIPVHGTKPVKSGLLRSQIRKAGIDVDAFNKLL